MVTPREGRRYGNPQPVGDILAGFMRVSGLKEKLRSPEVYDCWPEVAGPEASEHSRVIGFSNYVLHVEVDSAPWLQMLATFRKSELLDGIRQVMSGVRITDIKFKIGGAAGKTAGGAERGKWRKETTPPTTQATSRSSPA